MGSFCPACELAVHAQWVCCEVPCPDGLQGVSSDPGVCDLVCALRHGRQPGLKGWDTWFHVDPPPAAKPRRRIQAACLATSGCAGALAALDRRCGRLSAYPDGCIAQRSRGARFWRFGNFWASSSVECSPFGAIGGESRRDRLCRPVRSLGADYRQSRAMSMGLLLWCYESHAAAPRSAGALRPRTHQASSRSCAHPRRKGCE